MADPNHITFNSKAPVIRTFLREVGVSSRQIDTGSIDPMEAAQQSVSFFSLRFVARSEESVSGAKSSSKQPMQPTNISPEEAAYALRSIRKGRVRALFRTERCPGKGVAGPDIVANYHKDFSLFASRADHKVRFEDTCGFEHFSQFAPNDLRGVYFTDSTAPSELVRIGQAVVPVFKYIHGRKEVVGSAVIVSAHGKDWIVSAHHIFFDQRNGQWMGAATIDLENRLIPLEWDHVVREDRAHDYAIFRIPDLRPRTALTLVESGPDAAEPIWAIGFPDGLLSPNTPVPTGPIRGYTIGEFVMRNSLGELRSSLLVEQGASGGAIVNRRGELIGITLRLQSPVPYKYGYRWTSTIGCPLTPDLFAPRNVKASQLDAPR